MNFITCSLKRKLKMKMSYGLVRNHLLRFVYMVISKIIKCNSNSCSKSIICLHFHATKEEENDFNCCNDKFLLSLPVINII